MTWATLLLANLTHVVSNVYANLLKAINPDAVIVDQNVGLVTAMVRLGSKRVLDQLKGRSVFISEMCSRLLVMVATICVVVARILDFGVGIFLAVCSLIMLGKDDQKNRSAYSLLKILGVVSDVFVGIHGVISPDSYDSSSLKEGDPIGLQHCNGVLRVLAPPVRG